MDNQYKFDDLNSYYKYLRDVELLSELELNILRCKKR